VKDEGVPKFTMQSHTELWKDRDAKDPSEGLGVAVEGSWLWYCAWVEIVRDYCGRNPERFAEREPA